MAFPWIDKDQTWIVVVAMVVVAAMVVAIVVVAMVFVVFDPTHCQIYRFGLSASSESHRLWVVVQSPMVVVVASVVDAFQFLFFPYKLLAGGNLIVLLA